MKSKALYFLLLVGFIGAAQNNKDSVLLKNKILIEQLRDRIARIEDPNKVIEDLKKKERKSQDSIVALNDLLRQLNEKKLTEKYNSSETKSDKELNDELNSSSLVNTHLSDCKCNRLFYNVSQTKTDYNLFPEIDSIASLLSNKPELKIKLVGHSDKTGTETNNIFLSKSRVDNLKNYYIKEKKISATKIITEWHGSAIPSKDAMDSDKQFLNRRVEIYLVKE